MTPDTSHTLVHVADGAAALVAIASLANVIPQAAALFTLVWTGMRIYEMVTGKPFSQSVLARWLTGSG